MRVRCLVCGGRMADVQVVGSIVSIRYVNGHHRRGLKMDEAMKPAEGHIAGVAGPTPGSLGVVEAHHLVELSCSSHAPRHIEGRDLRNAAMAGQRELGLTPATNPFWWEIPDHPRR